MNSPQRTQSPLEMRFTGTKLPKDYTLEERGAMHQLRRAMEHLRGGDIWFFASEWEEGDVAVATFDTLNNCQVLIQRDAHARFLQTSASSASSAVKGVAE